MEFNGKSTMQSWFDASTLTGNIRSTIDQLNHTVGDHIRFDWEEPSFEWPGFFVGAFEGKYDWDEAAFITHKFAEEFIHPPLPSEDYPFVQYDSWAYGLDINEENQLQALEIAAQLGLEVFVLGMNCYKFTNYRSWVGGASWRVGT